MKSNLFKITFSLLITFTAFTFVSCDKGKALVIQKTAEEVNAQCPMTIDNVTQLTACEYVPEKSLKYTYTVDTDVLINEMGVADMEAFKKELQKQIVIQMHTLMNQESSKALKLLDPVLIHCYKDKNGEVISEITVTPDMYNNPLPAEEEVEETDAV
jgi:hypothetical protein